VGIERDFDVTLIAELALREKQTQQSYRPIIGVHKWFARRPGTLFRGLLLAEFGRCPLRDTFFESNDLSERRVADPFMGGGTPLIEANRLGCDVEGFDVNPMATWIVREVIEHLELEAYERVAAGLVDSLRGEVGACYRTGCPLYGDAEVSVKSFLWVKTLDCAACGETFDLFPGYLLAANRRHPMNVIVCWACGDLNEVADRSALATCRTCGEELRLTGPARRGRCDCPHCGHPNAFPGATTGPLQHRMFAIEYHNSRRRGEHRGRFFKRPDKEDFARAKAAALRWEQLTPRFVPDDSIPPGDETDRLHRWGYTRYRDMFNARQLLGLELSCRLVAEIEDARVRRALATNLSDLLRYQNLLCRYDTMALKALDIFSIHGFPVGLVQCESNLLGIISENGTNVGSGGWTNIIAKYAKAKRYCAAPFEVRRNGSRKVQVPIKDEWIGELHDGRRRSVEIRCADATQVDLPARSLDAVFTDPPYFGNVQYGELMDFCYVWLRRLVGPEAEDFERRSTRSRQELTGNATQARGLIHFSEGLSAVYSKMAHALKPGSPLAFTFHHNKLEAYFAVGTAILDAGLVCSASLPCPAEMGGSIHIHGTASSIVDTVFVCRSTGTVPRRWLPATPDGITAIVAEDVASLKAAGRTPTRGDTRCVVFGHLTRLAVWNLRLDWDETLPTTQKISRFAESVASLGAPDSIAGAVQPASTSPGPLFETAIRDKEEHYAIPF